MLLPPSRVWTSRDKTPKELVLLAICSSLALNSLLLSSMGDLTLPALLLGSGLALWLDGLGWSNRGLSDRLLQPLPVLCLCSVLLCFFPGEKGKLSLRRRCPAGDSKLGACLSRVAPGLKGKADAIPSLKSSVT